MNHIQTRSLLVLLLAAVTTSRTLSLPEEAVSQIANITYGSNVGSLTSIFSPRMDFDQWKPLTGRGDPLRNDPTYDYEPPVLERVHYWADDTRLEREHFPERKSEVLMLGVSSRKPSVTSRQPPTPPRRHIHRTSPVKYEDYTYKISDYYPNTILVPPPPPPLGHQPPLFVLSEDESSTISKIEQPLIHMTNTPNAPNYVKKSTVSPERLTSLYTLQEANLIYQSSTTSQNWINETKSIENKAVSTDYAGWGPTTPSDHNDDVNETHNLITNDHEISKHPYSFYKPVLSEAPPPPKIPLSNFLLLPAVVSTAIPPTVTPEPTTVTFTQVSWSTEKSNIEIPTEEMKETTTEIGTTSGFRPTPVPTYKPKPETTGFDMLAPMMTMPMVNGPDRPEDNLYSHASENIHVFNEQNTEDLIQIETMQTMQPPPPIKSETKKIASKNQFHVNSDVFNKETALFTHSPYLHKRFTTPIPTTVYEFSDNIKSTTETPTIPYLIIQGHSKVKTYGSKPADNNDVINNEISKPNETNEVKHLHPIKEKPIKKSDLIDDNRKSRAHNLKSLIDNGLGSFEIQETDIGIKYDVSDGSEVPIEIYRKGIVDSDENGYLSSKKGAKHSTRTKRQLDLEDLIPFDEDTIEEYVYNFLEGKKNDTGITGFIAQAVTSDAADAVVDELEEDDDDDDDESEQREER